MSRVLEEMTKYLDYILSQGVQLKPLYQWDPYHGYDASISAIHSLERAVRALRAEHSTENIILPEEYIRMCRRGGRQLSTSISKAAGHIMRTMRKRSENCTDEIEASPLDDIGKTEAIAGIMHELEKVIQYCVGATNHTWQAFDLLEERLIADELDKSMRDFLAKRIIEASEAHNRSPPKTGFWKAAISIVGVSIGVAIIFAAANMYSPGGFSPATEVSAHGDSLHTDFLSMVERTQHIANLTNRAHSAHFQDMNQRYKYLEVASQHQSLRIDNIVESLGPPNEVGTYYSSWPQLEHRFSEAARQSVGTVATELEDQLKRLRYDLKSLRRNVDNMDIRLTKRLDKLGR